MTNSEDIKQTGSPSDAEAELNKVKLERDEYLNGWKRAKADLINYQKDEARRLEEIAKFSTESVIRDVISVIDNLTHAFNSIKNSGGKVDEGLMLIQNQLIELIKKRGVTKIEVKPGETYDPKYHEAIAMVEPAGDMKSGTIAEEVEPGYILHDYVLKPARVKVVS